MSNNHIFHGRMYDCRFRVIATNDGKYVPQVSESRDILFRNWRNASPPIDSAGEAIRVAFQWAWAAANAVR